MLHFVLLLILVLPADAADAPRTDARLSGPVSPSPEAIARKARSVERLKADGVPVPDKLPVIADTQTARVRTRDEIARRAVAVCLTALKAERADMDTIEGLVKRYKAEKFFTPEELVFIESGAPTNEERTRYLWRYEGLVVLMWAAGYIDTLDRPDATCDIQKTVSPLSSRTAEQFIKEAAPRSTAEILDEADLIYRTQWAISDARRHGLKMPAGLDRTVVQQRFDMFSWLVSPLNLP